MADRESRVGASVPGETPGASDAPATCALLGGSAHVVMRAPGGSGKTAVLGHWAAHQPAGTVLSIATEGPVRTRTGFWMRAMALIHAAGMMDDAALYREIATIADAPDVIPDALTRVLGASIVSLTVIVDNVGAPEPGGHWDAICHDIVTVAERLPTVRWMVAGRFPTPLESPDVTRGLRVRKALEPEIVAAAQELQACDGELPHGAREGADGSAGPASLLERGTDPDIRDFVGITATAPSVTADFAMTLTGRVDAASLLDACARAGAGHWHTVEPGPAVFSYGDQFRSEAAARFAREHPQRLPALHGAIAQWLFHDRRDKLAALEHAVAAKDLDLTAHILLRSYPMSEEDKEWVGTLLDSIPQRLLLRHPLLSLRYALVLNSREGSQARAVEYFLSSTVVGRLKSKSTPSSEKALRIGMESAVWRLLGNDSRMADRAETAIEGIAEALGRADRDSDLDWIALTVLNQCGISMMYAGQPDRAADAFHTLEEAASSRGIAIFANVAQGGLALLATLSGDFARARAHLDRIDDDGWPESFAYGYRGAPAVIARAWTLLNGGDADGALAHLDLLAPHESTIEHWEMMLTVRTLARALQGHVHDAHATFSHTREYRTSRRTPPWTLARLEVADRLLSLATGRPRASRMTLGGTAGASIDAALTAMAAAHAGRAADAIAAVAAAESAARSPLDEAFAAIAALVTAHRGPGMASAQRHIARLGALVSERGLRWPVAAIAPEVRNAVQSTSIPSEALHEALRLIPAVVEGEGHASVEVPHLTRREREILIAMLSAESRSDLAAQLFVSVNTIKSQLRTLYAKLGVATRDEAIQRAFAWGLLERPGGSEDSES